MNDPIAIRNFSLLDDETKVQTNVTIRLFSPALEPAGEAFGCRHEIETEGGIRSARVVGIDGFQALQYALKILNAEVIRLRKTYGSSLIWLDHKYVYTGLEDLAGFLCFTRLVTGTQFALPKSKRR